MFRAIVRGSALFSAYIGHIFCLVFIRAINSTLFLFFAPCILERFGPKILSGDKKRKNRVVSEYELPEIQQLCTFNRAFFPLFLFLVTLHGSLPYFILHGLQAPKFHPPKRQLETQPQKMRTGFQFEIATLSVLIVLVPSADGGGGGFN